MSEKTNSKKQILFVDDELAFLEMIEGLFSLWSKNEWEIHLAHNSSKALAVIQQHPIDLAVIDVQMPVVDGLQLIRLLHQKYPNLPKVALTGSDNERYRTECLAAGAEMFFRKPSEIQGLETIFSNLNELMKLQPQEGFRGMLRRVGLEEVLHLECLGRKSSILEVVSKDMRGRVFIREGEIIHASVGELQGEAGFNRIFSLVGGEFSLKPFEEPPARTIQCSWEMLVMEAARMRDEGDNSTPAIPGQQTSTPGRPKEPQPSSTLGPAFSPGAKNPPPPTLQPLVDEMLICSTKGEVLYEWQCAESELRIQWIDFISKKAQELARESKLGKFDRLEIIGLKTRMVTEITPEWILLVRSSNPLGDATN